MGKATSQGTRHESHLRTRATALGRTARRLAKTGVKHEADVEVEGLYKLPVVAWKCYIPGDTRRKTLSMVILQEEDFWKLYELDDQENYGLYIQSKASQRIGVYAILKGLIDWTRNHG